MAQWEVEYTAEFGQWWHGLTEAQQVSVDTTVRLLEARGPQLGHPYSSGIKNSRHSKMRELRIQHRGRPVSRPVRVRSPAHGDPADRRGQVRQ